MDGHVTRTSHSDSQPRLWMTSGRSMSTKSTKMTQRSKRMSRREKFSEKALRASSSQNRIWKGVGSEDEDAPEWRGFWDKVDLHFGAIDTTNVNKKERERERDNLKNIRQFKNIKIYWIENTYAWGMHERVKCNRKFIMNSAQSNPTSTQSICTHLYAR